MNVLGEVGFCNGHCAYRGEDGNWYIVMRLERYIKLLDSLSVLTFGEEIEEVSADPAQTVNIGRVH